MHNQFYDNNGDGMDIPYNPLSFTDLDDYPILGTLSTVERGTGHSRALNGAILYMDDMEGDDND